MYKILGRDCVPGTYNQTGCRYEAPKFKVHGQTNSIFACLSLHQVTSSLLFTLCWWIPMVLVFSAASGHATDMWETQLRVWAGVVTSVIIGLFSPEPIRNICRR